MPDRVRGAVFETIGSRLGTPGALPAIRVLDLFAGSGSIGLEALSRGAAWCTFVERDRAALSALRHNLTGLAGDEAGTLAKIIRADAFAVRQWSRLVYGMPCDLIVVDPPYPDSRRVAPIGPVVRLLEALAETPLLAEGACVVLRHEAKVPYDRRKYGRLRATEVRRYGSTAVTYLTCDPK